MLVVGINNQEDAIRKAVDKKAFMERRYNY